MTLECFLPQLGRALVIPQREDVLGVIALDDCSPANVAALLGKSEGFR